MTYRPPDVGRQWTRVLGSILAVALVAGSVAIVPTTAGAESTPPVASGAPVLNHR
jgi:hypothetical protein